MKNKLITAGTAILFGLESLLLGACATPQKKSEASQEKMYNLESYCKKDAEDKISWYKNRYQKEYPGYAFDASSYKKSLANLCKKCLDSPDEPNYMTLYSFKGNANDLINAVRSGYEKQYGKDYDRVIENIAETLTIARYADECSSQKETDVQIPNYGAVLIYHLHDKDPVLAIGDNKITLLNNEDLDKFLEMLEGANKGPQITEMEEKK